MVLTINRGGSSIFFSLFSIYEAGRCAVINCQPCSEGFILWPPKARRRSWHRYCTDFCLPVHGRYSLFSFFGISLNRFRNVYLKDVSHVKLLKSIQSLDGKKAPIIQRNEATLGTSEYHNRGKTSRSAA